MAQQSLLVAGTLPFLLLAGTLLFLLLGSHALCCKPQQWGSSYGKGSASSSRWGRWNQQESWGSRAYGGQDREFVLRVETGEHDKKRRKRSKKEKKRRKSSSSDSSTPALLLRRRKRRKGFEKGEKASKSAALSNSDLEELRAFRRRAEIEKVRDEVKAGMVEHSPGSKHDKGCHQAGYFDAKNQKFGVGPNPSLCGAVVRAPTPSRQTVAAADEP